MHGTLNKYFDTAVCFIWHSQALFWGAIFFICVERGCYRSRKIHFHLFPLQTWQISRRLVKKEHCCLIRCQRDCDVTMFLSSPFRARCLHFGIFHIRTYRRTSVLRLWFALDFAVYALPVMAYVFLYGRVVLTLYRRKNSTHVNRSAVVMQLRRP